MLELKGIVKDYPTGVDTVHALKGISLKFRESEFVSVLGPSGCGKTTMLNIIGGLDQYTEGDLIINGKSTKDFNDRDWDTYRNHSIGFVFQSYNLIPHQTVLQNVELALTLSGVSKTERRKRAKEALEMVGLSTQENKKPGEMSGGQMQRVAIGRAIVNNPEIVLADEPTGALDTETSVQVMDILKEIAKDRLVIMVTHNPELANRYSTRIINMLDGVITGDSAPISEEESEAERQKDLVKSEKNKKIKKPSMSFATSFGLSLKNLFTKKGRTALTSFAGSIGIIGIALILAVSQGTTSYIDTLQEDTLSSYPLTIEDQNINLSSVMQTFMNLSKSEQKHQNDAVYKKAMIYDMVNSLNNLEAEENDLKSFKKFIDEERDNTKGKLGLDTAISGVQYSYDLDMNVYTKNLDGTVIKSDTQELMQGFINEYMGIDMSAVTQMSESSSTSGVMSMMTSMSPMTSSSNRLWQEMLPGDNGKIISPLLEKQYDVVYGSWPNSYDEIVLVLDENNELDDLTLYALGLEKEEEIDAIMNAAMTGAELDADLKSWSYDEICDLTYRVALNANRYTYDEATGTYNDLSLTDAGLKYIYDNGIDLKVTGIVKPNADTEQGMLNGSIAYTSALTEHIIKNSKDLPAVKAQLGNTDTDIFTGKPFKENTGELTDEQKLSELKEYLSSLDENAKAEAYIKIMGIPTDEQVNEMVSQAMSDMTREKIEEAMIQALTSQMGMSENDVKSYIEKMEDDELQSIYMQMVSQQVKSQYANQVSDQLSSQSPGELAKALDAALNGYSKEQAAVYYDSIMEFSDSTYEDNLRKLGFIDIDSPSAINLYSASFEDKDTIEAAISEYNKDVDEVSQIKYTDYVGLMMSSVTSIINAITYVLIAFVAVSLIVSSIMIGVITLISVQERTKEIGILRAIGASKKNISGMFNAETIIIGFTSGALGVLITYLLCIPINIVLHKLTNINSLSAMLPVPAAIILIVISILLTLVAGIIPSRSAAKKDPVVALRTE